MVAGACGSAAVDTAADNPTGTEPGVTTPTTATTVPVLVPVTGGWIGDEPDWRGAVDEAMRATDDELVMMSADAAEPEGDMSAPMPVEPDGGIGGGDEPLPPERPPVDNAPLRAGSVDDNVDYEGYLAYLDRLADVGIVLRDLDASGRIVVTVTGSNGLPVSGAEITARAGDDSMTLRTTADGTARFLPWYLAGADTAQDAPIEFSVGEVTATAQPGGEAAITLDTPGGTAAPVPLDILFLLDATGSMGDEIDRLKTTIDTVASRVAALDPQPDVRFAMTLYRDVEDSFVTANYDFTSDVAEFQAALADVVADGGGDYAEALDEGLADALTQPTWRDPAGAVQLIFVVADAPPQVGRQVEMPYPDSIREAVGRGIKIFPVASSESDDQAEAVFRQMAQATGAPFVFLSNGANGASLGESTDIDSTDYEELALDELVVRLIAEELSDLNGDDGDVTVPTTIAPTTTIPQGQ